VKRRLATLLAALVAALGLTAVTAGPASASWDACIPDRVCLWDGNDATGTFLFMQLWAPGTCVNVITSINDRANSFRNRMSAGRGVQFYRDANCTGHAMHHTNGYGGPNGPFLPGAFGNFISDGKATCHCDRNIVTSVIYNNV